MSSTLCPEWAPVEAIIIAWPYPGSDWNSQLVAAQDCYWEMLKEFSQRVETWVLLHPTIDVDKWNDELPHHCDKRNVKVIPNIEYNDTWVRDYGPLSLSDSYFSFKFNGWGGKYPAAADNQVAKQLAAHLPLPLREVDFVAEGGALEINSAGVLLANQDCLVDTNRNRNFNKGQIAKLLQDYIGVKKIEWLDGIQLSGDDTDGHIDTIARFANDHTVVYCGQNSKHPDAKLLQSLELQIKEIALRNHWQTQILPTPVVKSQQSGDILPATYANFLICNEYVFVPVYGLDCDPQALAVLAKAFANSTIVPIRCEALLEQHGSLHCATMQLARLPFSQ